MVDLEQMINQRFIDNEKLSTAQHKLIFEKIDNIDTRFTEKIEKLEKSSNEFQKWKHYIIAVVAIISLAIPIAADYIF